MIKGLLPYSAGERSGVPWLGEAPAHWRPLPGRACFAPKHHPNSGLVERTILSLSYGHLIVRPEQILHGLVPSSFETYQIVEPADIVCRPTDLQNDQTSLRFAFSRLRGSITSAYLCLATREPVLPRFGYLLLHAYDLKKIFYGMGSGLRQNLRWEDFKYLPCLIPPIEEQAAIVRFLDYVDQRIRRLIRAKQKLIRLLEKQKLAIIHRAVTRGLDPNVGLKPSGVEWLGDVPKHWEVRRCRYLFREVDSRSLHGSEQHLSMSQRLGLVPSELVENRTLVSEDHTGGKLCEVGDLVLNRLKAHLGVFALAEHEGVVSPDYTVFRPIPPRTAEYFELVLKSPACRRELRIRAKGIVEGFWRLYTGDFNDIRLPVPPIGEQSSIAARISAVKESLNTIRDKAAVEIQLMKELRTRLIADVVTGKLDVREAAAQLPEEGEAADEEELEVLAEETEYPEGADEELLEVAEGAEA